MTTVMSSSSTQRSKSTRTAPPPRPPPPRNAFSIRKSKPSKETSVAVRKVSSPEPADRSAPPPKPPRSYTAMSDVRQKSATLPSSLRGTGKVDMEAVLRRYDSSDGDRKSLPPAVGGGAEPMDVVSDKTIETDPSGVTDFNSDEEDSHASESKKVVLDEGSQYRVQSLVESQERDETGEEEEQELQEGERTGEEEEEESQHSRNTSVSPDGSCDTDASVVKDEVPLGGDRTQVERKESGDAPSDSGRTKPPQRPPRPHITVYQKYITSSNTREEDKKVKKRERKTVGHIYLPDTPPQSPPRPPSDSYQEFLSPSASSKSEPVEVEVEIRNDSDQGSLSPPAEPNLGNTIMRKYQAPVAGEVIEESEEFEYPEWARSRTKGGKTKRKTQKAVTPSKDSPRPRQQRTKLKSLLSLCSGWGSKQDDCSKMDGTFDLSEMKSSPVDPLVIQSIAYLNRDKILKEEGLFRIPGDVTEIQRLYGRFRSGQSVDLMCVADPACVSGLLKMFCRNKSDPLIPHGPPCLSLSTAARERDLQGVKNVLEKLPEANYMTLQMVIEIFYKVCQFSKVNQMTSSALATSCGLSVFPAMQASTSGQVLKFLIDRCVEVFELPIEE